MLQPADELERGATLESAQKSSVYRYIGGANNKQAIRRRYAKQALTSQKTMQVHRGLVVAGLLPTVKRGIPPKGCVVVMM